MHGTQIRERLNPILDEIARQSTVADTFVDKTRYRIFLATFYANLVMNPSDAGLAVEDIEQAFEAINCQAKTILGGHDPITEAYRFIASREGEKTMNEEKLTSTHKELLTYFASMILDPEGHKKWMDEISTR